MGFSGALKLEIKFESIRPLSKVLQSYAAEVWTAREHLKHKLLATEMGFWRPCCGLTLLDGVT